MKRFKHNLSHYHLTTCDMGELVPIGMVEALPGDTFQHNANVLARVSPLAAPVMHPVSVRLHHFFVPSRICAEFAGGTFDWESFITGGEDGNDAQTIPQIPNTSTARDLLDHYGLPRVATIGVNALPIAAYNLIFNEYYRDQDLGTKRLWNDTTLAHIAWQKDYFTTSRPWTQKGSDVTVPLGDKAYVKSDAAGATSLSYQGPDDGFYTMDASAALLGAQAGVGSEADSFYADLSTATGANINEIRRAFAVQRYQEARARYGSRYSEYLRYLGVVNPPDSRLQRPEFLGGGTTQINFSEVLQTGQETGASTNAVGDMYGHGIAAMRSNRYRRYIEEHGFVISLLSVRPKTIYTSGIHRSWLKRDKEDYFQKELQYIGQQEVENNEVYADVTSGHETFGYQDRYNEYREHPSTVSGEFRDVLNYWHLGREFEAAPALNESFVKCVPSKRIHNEQTMSALWVMAQHRLVARRSLDKSAAPRIF